MMKYIKKLHHGEKGFTIVEVLMVVAILGILAVVAGVNFGKYIGQSKTETYATELQEIQTATSVMLADCTSHQMSAVPTPTDDMDTVQSTGPGVLKLSSYLKNLDSDDKVMSGCTYTFTTDGAVTQITP